MKTKLTWLTILLFAAFLYLFFYEYKKIFSFFPDSNSKNFAAPQIQMNEDNFGISFAEFLISNKWNPQFDKYLSPELYTQLYQRHLERGAQAEQDLRTKPLWVWTHRTLSTNLILIKNVDTQGNVFFSEIRLSRSSNEKNNYSNVEIRTRPQPFTPFDVSDLNNVEVQNRACESKIELLQNKLSWNCGNNKVTIPTRKNSEYLSSRLNAVAILALLPKESLQIKKQIKDNSLKEKKSEYQNLLEKALAPQ